MTTQTNDTYAGRSAEAGQGLMLLVLATVLLGVVGMVLMIG